VTMWAPVSEHIGEDLSYVSIDQYRAASGWQARFKLLTRWGACVPLKPALRCQEHAVSGCQVSTWIAHRKGDQGEHYFIFDSDSKIVRGLSALLLVPLQGQSSQQIVDFDMAGFMAELTLERHLSPSRNNGVKALLLRAYQQMELPLAL